MNRFTLLLLAALLLIGGAALPYEAAEAQGGVCPPFVEDALLSLDANCGSLGRDTACYGNNRVDSVFWMARDELVFSAPADRVPLIDLQTISTSPLDVRQELWGVAVMHLQANLPDTLPGQAVTFVLMGDSTLENAVPPELAADATVIEPVPAETVFAANLRSRPTTAANVITSVREGTPLTLVGRTEAGDWFETRTAVGGNAWVLNELVAEDDDAAAALPVTYGPNAAPRYGPMQAFYLSTGFGSPTCNEAPDALVVNNTELAEVTLNVNGLEVHLGSTVVFTVYTDPATGQSYLYFVLIHGHLRTTLNGVPISLDRPGQGVIITLNADGAVDGSSRVIALAPGFDFGRLSHQFCMAAANLPFDLPGLADVDAEFCMVPPTLFAPPVQVPPVQPPTGGQGSGSDPTATEVPTEPPPAGWGDCGSCDYCGPYAQEECVRSPEGACLWDPATCGYHGPTGSSSPYLSGPGSMTCVYMTTPVVTINYNSPDGSTLTGASAVSNMPSDVPVLGTSAGANSINVQLSCVIQPTTATITVTASDSAGRSFSYFFIANVP